MTQLACRPNFKHAMASVRPAKMLDSVQPQWLQARQSHRQPPYRTFESKSTIITFGFGLIHADIN